MNRHNPGGMPGVRITVVYSAKAGHTQEYRLSVPVGTTVGEALHTSGFLDGYPELRAAHSALLIGVWGKRVQAMHTLRMDDRIEIYRPLRVDPKIARRERFNQQGSRGAGLFSKKSGVKAGSPA